jgi:hypothetical protein
MSGDDPMLRTLTLSALAILLVGLALRQGVSQNAPAAAQPSAIIDAANYPTLQAALDALPPSGGVVRIGPGEWVLHEPLVLRKEDVLLIGAGTATHLKNANTQGKPALIIEPPGLAQNPRAGLWRVSVQNLRLTGNEQSGAGILARHVNEIYLQGITVSYHGGHGIHLDNCYEDPRICNCLITYNKQTGLQLDGCHDIVVCGNQFEENLDALVCRDGFNLCMTGNCLDDHLRHGVVIENTYGSVVSGNMIEECQGTAIILDRDCYGITLSANVIAHESSGGIDLRDAHGCAVSANTFTIVKKDALRIGPGSGRITVTGNNFSNSFIGEGSQKRTKTDSDAAGIVLEGTRDIAITGNLFSGLTSKALALPGQPSERILFSSNVLTEVESDHTQLPAETRPSNLH